MIKLGLLETALLLGLYVALAGTYGLVFAMARLWDGPTMRRVSVTLYALHCLVAFAIVIWTPLEIGWKALLVAFSIAFFAIPPITWRYLERSHQHEV